MHGHEKVSLGYGLSSTRFTDPAIDITDLSPLDLILLSYFRGDHFDKVAERDLQSYCQNLWIGVSRDLLITS